MGELVQFCILEPLPVGAYKGKWGRKAAAVGAGPVQGGLQRDRSCHDPAGTQPHLCPHSPQGPVCPPCTDRQLLSLVHGDTASSPVCPLAGEGTPAHLVPLHSPGCHLCPVCSVPSHAHLCQPQRLAPTVGAAPQTPRGPWGGARGSSIPPQALGLPRFLLVCHCRRNPGAEEGRGARQDPGAGRDSALSAIKRPQVTAPTSPELARRQKNKHSSNPPLCRFNAHFFLFIFV